VIVLRQQRKVQQVQGVQRTNVDYNLFNMSWIICAGCRMFNL